MGALDDPATGAEAASDWSFCFSSPREVGAANVAGYKAAVFSARDDKRIRKSFPTLTATKGVEGR